MLYQPRIKDPLIRKLYFKAKREGRKMTHLVNEALEDYLYGEPDPPIEGRKDVKNLYRAQREQHCDRGEGNHSPEREQGATAETPAYPFSLGHEG